MFPPHCTLAPFCFVLFSSKLSTHCPISRPLSPPPFPFSSSVSAFHSCFSLSFHVPPYTQYICHFLHLHFFRLLAHKYSTYELATGNSSLARVRCIGDESRLIECFHMILGLPLISCRRNAIVECKLYAGLLKSMLIHSIIKPAIKDIRMICWTRQPMIGLIRVVFML